MADHLAVGLPPAQAVVDAALAPGGDDGRIVIVEEHSEADVRFANNQTTSNGVRRTRQVVVVSLRAGGGAMKSGQASGAGDVDVADLVTRAQRDANGAQPAEDASPLLEARQSPDFAAAPEVTDLSVLSGVLHGLAGAFSRAEGNYVLAGFADHDRTTTYLGTSTGTRLRYSQPTGSLQLVARSPDAKASAWVGVGTKDYADVSLESLEHQLTERLGWARRQVELEAGRYEVILPPSAQADLMADLVGAASGREAEDGRTVFSRPGGGTRLGDILSEMPFELRSDPAEPGLECSPFVVTGASDTDTSVFDNGLPTERTPWIEAGRLARLRYHRAGGRAAGQPPAPWIDNLVLELPGATGTTEDLVARTERGLLLTCLWYIREVDPVTLLLTGLTRDGVYLIEDGKVSAAVNNFRFNESPVDLLARVTEAGASVRTLGREWNEWLNRTRMPPLRIPDFNMSSVSPAS